MLLLAVFVGAAVVTFNSRVLGAHISFLQSVSMLGYCVFPLFLAALLIRLLRAVRVRSLPVSLAIVAVCAFWSIMGKSLPLLSCSSIHRRQHTSGEKVHLLVPGRALLHLHRQLCCLHMSEANTDSIACL